MACDSDIARAGAAALLGVTYNQDFNQMLPSVAAVGTPDEVTEQRQSFADAGARHLLFTPATRVDARPITERIVADVVPRLHVPVK